MSELGMTISNLTYICFVNVWIVYHILVFRLYIYVLQYYSRQKAITVRLSGLYQFVKYLDSESLSLLYNKRSASVTISNQAIFRSLHCIYCWQSFELYLSKWSELKLFMLFVVCFMMNSYSSLSYANISNCFTEDLITPGVFFLFF